MKMRATAPGWSVLSWLGVGVGLVGVIFCGPGLHTHTAMARQSAKSRTQDLASLRRVLKHMDEWWLSCGKLTGTLKKDLVIQGVPLMKDKGVELILKRERGFATGLSCRWRDRKKRKYKRSHQGSNLCTSCDRCATYCYKKQRWTYPVISWRLRAGVLSRPHDFAGITFRKGTPFVLRPSGKLRRAVLVRSQPLFAKKTGKSLPFPKNIPLDFYDRQTIRNERRKIPTTRLFRLGTFTCYYVDGMFGVACGP